MMIITGVFLFLLGTKVGHASTKTEVKYGGASDITVTEEKDDNVNLPGLGSPPFAPSFFHQGSNFYFNPQYILPGGYFPYETERAKLLQQKYSKNVSVSTSEVSDVIIEKKTPVEVIKVSEQSAIPLVIAESIQKIPQVQVEIKPFGLPNQVVAPNGFEPCVEKDVERDNAISYPVDTFIPSNEPILIEEPQPNQVLVEKPSIGFEPHVDNDVERHNAISYPVDSFIPSNEPILIKDPQTNQVLIEELSTGFEPCLENDVERDNAISHPVETFIPSNEPILNEEPQPNQVLVEKPSIGFEPNVDNDVERHNAISYPVDTFIPSNEPILNEEPQPNQVLVEKPSIGFQPNLDNDVERHNAISYPVNTFNPLNEPILVKKPQPNKVLGEEPSIGFEPNLNKDVERHNAISYPVNTFIPSNEPILNVKPQPIQVLVEQPPIGFEPCVENDVERDNAISYPVDTFIPSNEPILIEEPQSSDGIIITEFDVPITKIPPPPELPPFNPSKIPKPVYDINKRVVLIPSAPGLGSFMPPPITVAEKPYFLLDCAQNIVFDRVLPNLAFEKGKLVELISIPASKRAPVLSSIVY